jgi:hypothetical protein
MHARISDKSHIPPSSERTVETNEIESHIAVGNSQLVLGLGQRALEEEHQRVIDGCFDVLLVGDVERLLSCFGTCLCKFRPVLRLLKPVQGILGFAPSLEDRVLVDDCQLLEAGILHLDIAAQSAVVQDRPLKRRSD